MSNRAATHFSVIVPVKPVAHAKSRLATLGDEVRRSLVEAFAVDTVAAALASPLVDAVLVVTDDHLLAAGLSEVGAEVVPDGAADDMNASLVQAAAEAQRRWPDLAIAALCADLPALRTDELTRALEVASAHSASFVPDESGDGTTMVAALTRESFLPRFGVGSRDAHVSQGAHELVEIDLPTLRHDVDTPGDLQDALELGVGSRTALVATGLRL